MRQTDSQKNNLSHIKQKKMTRQAVTERIKKTLHIKTIKKEYRTWFYTVEHNGIEHDIRMFDFQKEEKRDSDNLQCLIERLPNGTEIIKQDQAPLIAKRYEVGKIYKFKVRRDAKHPKLFTVKTQENFTFFLENPQNSRYTELSEILGRIKSINGVKVMVEEVELEKNCVGEFSNFIEPSVIGQLSESLGVRPAVRKWMSRVFAKHVDFADARTLLKARSTDWLSEAAGTIRDEMPLWVRRIGKREHLGEALRELRRVGIEILERSKLATGNSRDAGALRETLASCINKADEYTSALNKMNDGTIAQYAQSAMDSMERTGYIYEPIHRLHVMTSAMATDQSLMDQWMPDLFKIMSSGNLSDWRQEPLRKGLLDLLTTYVYINAPAADKVMDIALGGNKVIVGGSIKAIAMILMLSDEDDDINRRKLMAQMCRYSSLYNSKAEFRNALNDKAYGFLLTHTPSALPFSWSDLRSSNDVLGWMTQNATLIQGPTSAVRYEGEKISVKVYGRDVTIEPTSCLGKMRDVLPKGIIGWRNFHVMLCDRNFSTSAKADTDDISELRRMWRDIEDSLLDTQKNYAAQGTDSATHKIKSFAEKGDEVTIRITQREGKNESGQPFFHAKIVSDSIEGEGTIAMHDIVKYNVKNATAYDFTRDGKQMLFKAEVKDIRSNGQCEFSMLNQIYAFIYNDDEFVRKGDEVLCKVTRTASRDYLLISECGYSLKMLRDDDTPDLQNGDLVMAEIVDVFPNGNINSVFAGTADEDEPYIQDIDCLRNMLNSYANGVYEPEEDGSDDEEQEEEEDDEDQGEMERAELKELMSIVDRQSSMAETRACAFNLLAIARLMALSLGDKGKAQEYHDRMTFIHLMQQYAVSQWIDTDEFERHYERSKGILSANPDLQDQVMRLFCISRMEKDGSENELAQVIAERRGTLTGKVAGLVMAYNILKPHDMEPERRSIRNKINELLGVEAHDVSHLEFMGEENATLEFKTSMVYPPEKGSRPDKEKQCINLLNAVCGMMNSQGGRLLVGVNDSGMAEGLDADFRFLCDSRYDEQKARDVMQNLFVSTLRNHMPAEASSYFRVSFEEHKGRSVFVVDVDSADKVMSVDGTAFRRVGASTRVMDENERRQVEALKKSKK